MNPGDLVCFDINELCDYFFLCQTTLIKRKTVEINNHEIPISSVGLVTGQSLEEELIDVLFRYSLVKIPKSVVHLV